MRDDYIFVVLEERLLWGRRLTLSNLMDERATPLPYILKVLA
jgi:hypothetical protein